MTAKTKTELRHETLLAVAAYSLSGNIITLCPPQKARKVYSASGRATKQQSKSSKPAKIASWWESMIQESNVPSRKVEVDFLNTDDSYSYLAGK